MNFITSAIGSIPQESLYNTMYCIISLPLLICNAILYILVEIILKNLNISSNILPCIS